MSFGHTGTIHDLAFSRDGHMAMSASGDGTIRVWDTETWHCLQILEGHTKGVTRAAWGPDGKQIVSGSLDDTLRIWDLHSGQCTSILQGHTDNIWSLAWSPDGKQIISGSVDRTLRVWDPVTGACKHILAAHTDSISTLAFSSDGQLAVSGSEDFDLRIWDTATWKCIDLLKGHYKSVNCVAWSPDGKQVISGSSDQILRIWDVQTRACVAKLTGHEKSIFCVAWSSDGRYVISGSLDHTLRVWNAQTGQSLQVLKKHPGVVWSLAWSPNGKQVISGSEDHTIWIWETANWQCKEVLEAHSATFYSFAWSPDRKLAVSASDDYIPRVWDTTTGKCIKRLEGYVTDRVITHAWSYDGKYIAIGSETGDISVWEVATGKCIALLPDHDEAINCLLWDPVGKLLISSADDHTLRFWDTGVDTFENVYVLEENTTSVNRFVRHPDGKLFIFGFDNGALRVWDYDSGEYVRNLEGHTAIISSLILSPDGRQIVSGSDDNTLRVWDLDTGQCTRVLEGHTSGIGSLAWNPNGRYILSGSYDGSLRLWENQTGSCIWEFKDNPHRIMAVAWSEDGLYFYSCTDHGVGRIWDRAAMAIKAQGLTSSAPALFQYTNAKVLLVGETGVGKSGLAGRLVQKQFAPTISSHARKAHTLETTQRIDEHGITLHQETILWDLAGQPAYRLVHQLSMEDAALACVLFDCRKETNLLEDAAYWSQALDQAHTNTKLKKILVASRIDAGGLPASIDRIKTFARENGFDHFIATSALTGEGCDTLLKTIRQEIPWNDLPKVTTSLLLVAIRQYILSLKKRQNNNNVPESLLTVETLHKGFETGYSTDIPIEEFMVYLRRLEDGDVIDLLVFHTADGSLRPGDFVLLDPTRIDAYASALLVAAKDEPDGPGHLLESRIREGNFKLPEEERIDQASEQHILWFVLEKLLARDLALREQINGADYIVFPSQCTSEFRFPGATTLGVAFTFAGPVRNIYATLIAQLAHYEGFNKREFFHDAAAYDAGNGQRCIIRYHDQKQGQGELEVLFDTGTPANIRQGFIQFIEKHLRSRSNPGSVTTRYAYHCANTQCGELFDDRVVKANLAQKHKDLVCPFCRKKTALIDLLGPQTTAANKVASQMGANARAGRQRMTASLVIRAKEAEGRYDVFLSHHSKDKAAVEKIAEGLLSVGIRPWLDKWELAAGAIISDALENAIKTIPCAALFFGPGDIGKWHIMEIRSYIERWAAQEARMIPVILPGTSDKPDIPMFIRQTLWVDMRDWENKKSDAFYRLVCGIVNKAPGSTPMKKFSVRDVVKWQGGIEI